MRIVLFGDIHVYRLAIRPWHLLSKRVLGMANLWLNRRSRFDLSLLAPTVQRIASLQPDLLLSSGDMTTVATHGEFADARKALGPLLEKFDSLIVPGNHDRYTFTASRTKRFERYFIEHCPISYPHHRQLGDGLHLIALDPCKPNLLLDGGDVRKQLPALEQILNKLNSNDRLIVLSHYTLGRFGTPPDQKTEPTSHTMRGDEQLHALLTSTGIPTLYLHGHVHKPWCCPTTGSDKVIAINAGAPLHICDRYPRGQGFWQIETGPPWQLTRHVMDGDGNWQTASVDTP